jgi:DNA-binding beta-propeller fold protein YncE
LRTSAGRFGVFLSIPVMLPVLVISCHWRLAMASDTYRIVQTIPAEAIYWDYASIDPKAGQLYLGRMGGVLSLDLKTLQVTEKLFQGQLIHGAIPLAEHHVVVATDGGASELVVFDSKSKKVMARVKVGGHPDALAYDRATDTVITANKETQDLTLVNARTWVVDATIPLKGDPEFVATNDHGTAYVNIADRGQIAVIDLAARRIVRRKTLLGCKEPSGAAYDERDNVVVSVCGNGVAKFLSGDKLQQVASIVVGKGADAVILDSARHLVFIPGGDDGTLTVIAVRSATDIAQIGVIKTEVGARSGAVDVNTGTVYLPTGKEVREDRGSGQWHPPKIVPNSFAILVVSPSAGVN